MGVELLLGDEAIARGALDAGISGCYAYPGTPSTEIMEHVQADPGASERGVHRCWSANEKSAMEEALGVSYVGKRALVCMKHVGLNVAADGFVNSAITGTVGGLVVVVADDPSMHSSQNEQDSRFYAHFAHVPCFEPATQQEAYDMMAEAFDCSEAHDLPVLVRITTRLAHSRANVTVGDRRAENELRLPEDKRQFVLLPSIARRNYDTLIAKQPDLLEDSERCAAGRFQDGMDDSLGIIAAGIAQNYLMEAFGQRPCPYPVLGISRYPLPREGLQKLRDRCGKILVLEEGAPFIEEMLHGPYGLSDAVIGKLTGDLPRTGELRPETVAAALGIDMTAAYSAPDLVGIRPPRLCGGCPHIHSYDALAEVIEEMGDGHVFSDIGCYTLGALPPYEAINSCVDMGASISMAKGASDAGFGPVVAVIGDSTFTHSGLTPLLDAAYDNTPMTVLLLDNGTTAMTGGQDSPGLGKYEQICVGLGILPEHVRTVVPLPKNHDQIVKVLREEVEYEGVSVVIAQRECIHVSRKRSS